MNRQYKDILEYPHHVSDLHPHMPLSDRAAQFSPFSALTGYDEAIQEEGRFTGRKIELGEDARDLLDEKLRIILDGKKDSMEIVFTCFRPDGRKEGGGYITIRGFVKKLDPCEKAIILKDGTYVPLDNIVNIQGICF